MRSIFGRYKFTDKKHPLTGILSVVLSVISIAGLIAAIVTTYHLGGDAPFRMGVVCFLSLLMAVAGIVLGIIGLRKYNSFHIFPIAGLVLNVGIILNIIRIVYAGVTVV
ncbi:MAG: DUF6142 family protein [Lachnospiraceae bacterium]|nr:DUF6142 family protein [Lachnospiraceae bacterium]